MRDSALNDPVGEDEGGSLMELRTWIYWRAEWDAKADQVEELEAELREIKEDRDAWEQEARSQRIVVERQTFDVMARVREWFHDRILAKRDVPKILVRDLDDIVLGRV